MRLAVAQVLITADGGQRELPERLVEPGPQRPDRKGVAVEKDQNVSRGRVAGDDVGQLVQLRGVAAFEVGGVVEAFPEGRVVDPVQGGEDPVGDVERAFDVMELGLDPPS